jgi:dephospho-CoA kinase
VHPSVANHFNKWLLKQTAPYSIKEVAILFENDGYKHCDFVITVTAPKDLRIQRVLKRDNTTKDAIEAIIKNQWTDEQKVKLSQFVITNIELENTKRQVVKVHRQILRSIE